MRARKQLIESISASLVFHVLFLIFAFGFQIPGFYKEVLRPRPAMSFRVTKKIDQTGIFPEKKAGDPHLQEKMKFEDFVQSSLVESAFKDSKEIKKIEAKHEEENIVKSIVPSQ